jgi:hypothetical protein
VEPKTRESASAKETKETIDEPAYISPHKKIISLNNQKDEQSSGLAIASMVFGILGIVGGWMCCGLLFSILAVLLGHVAYYRIQHYPEQYAGKGMAIAGFTTGYVGLLIGIVVSLLLGSFGTIMTVIMAEIARVIQQVGLCRITCT